jgi:4,5-dihydroxyphthalate decarboxylase
MHLVVIRRDVYERHPWIGNSLYKGLVEAKAMALARMRKTGAHPYMLPWVHHDIEEIKDVFGGDPYPYGVEANRPTLEALVQYMAEQHFIPQPIPIADLFVPVVEGHG